MLNAAVLVSVGACFCIARVSSDVCDVVAILILQLASLGSRS